MRVAIAGSTGLIGTKLVALARSDGHDVVEVSRSSGFDLTDEAVLPRLAEALADVDAVVDVTQGASFEQDEAVSFFRSVAGHLGQAAHEAGVRRTVVLSIVGIEESPDYGYYVGKVAQEKAHRENSPGVLVLRATQFHEFPGQMVEWFTTDGVADVMDVEFQPVDSAEVVRLLARDGDRVVRRRCPTRRAAHREPRRPGPRARCGQGARCRGEAGRSARIHGRGRHVAAAGGRRHRAWPLVARVDGSGELTLPR